MPPTRIVAMDFSKQILNKEYEKCIQVKTEKVYRRIPDSLRGIWVELDNDPVNIGIYMQKILTKFRNEGIEK